jgi:hypothetical protein
MQTKFTKQAAPKMQPGQAGHTPCKEHENMQLQALLGGAQV